MSQADPSRPGARAPLLRRLLRERAGPVALGLVLAAQLVLAVGSARQKSVTVDELGHLPSGLYTLETGDPRYATLNPPLVNALSALPVLLLDLERAPEPPPPSEDVFSFWSNGYHFHERHRDDYRRIFDAARLAPIAVAAALGALLFCWGRRLAPQAPELAGLLAAGFWCLSPNVLAQARLVGTDTGTAFFVALALWSLRALLRRPGPATALACGAALGLAQLAKLYALLLYPASLAIAVAWLLLPPRPRPAARRALAALAGAWVVSLLVLDSGYLWREVGTPLADLALGSETLRGLQGSPLAALPVPLPGAWLRALDGQLVEVGSPMPSFLFGETFQGGRWYFYPALLAVKTPLALLAAFGLALFLSLRGTRLPAREAVLLLAYPALLFATLSLAQGRQLGLRALLSATPPVWLWAAATVGRAGPRRWPAALAGAALAGTLATSVAAFPDYLSYFNAFAGGRDAGYRYASEANVDIGQDLVQLAEYLEAEGAERVQLLYFGSVDPALYGIDFEIPGARLAPGLLAVSVSLYHMSYPMYDRGRLRRVGPVDTRRLGPPVASIGGSIHVYRVGP